jgi:hypothetical protein
MLGNVRRRAAIFAAEREALRQTQSVRMTGAANPIVAALGSRPTRNVDRPMIMMVTRKVYLRPTMSPTRPNTSAPKGRTKKPAANASSAKMSRVAGG